MKNRLLFTLALLCFIANTFVPNKVKANHGTGGELIYVHLGDSAYQFILKFYRDCTGPQAPGAYALCAYNSLTNSSFTQIMNPWTGPLPPDNRNNGDPISPGCSNSSTTCDTPPGTTPGYEEYWYTCIVPRLPFRTNWRFGILDGGVIPPTQSLCCRNGSYNLNPNNPFGQFYIETGLTSTHTFKNSSPYYSIKPVPYVCLNVPFQFNNGALDADGDSLFTYLTTPLANLHCTTAAVPIPFTQPPAGMPSYNLTNNPFQTSGSFFLNGINGQFGFTATLLGKGALSTKTDEYRTKDPQDTYQIGYIMRDMQVQVTLCDVKPPKLDTFSIDAENGSFINGVAHGCIGQPLKFCMMVASPDAETVLKISDNLANHPTLKGANVTYSDQGTDSVKVCFEWTPANTNVGRHSLILLIRDSTCKPPGILFNYAHTVDMVVWDTVVAVTDMDTICAGEPYSLDVTGGGDWEWSVLSGSFGSIPNPNQKNPLVYPQVTTRYVVTSKANEYCLTGRTDTVDIHVLPGTEIAGQGDTVSCPGFAMPLDIGMVTEPGYTYGVSWTPAKGLSSTTIPNPTATLDTTTQYIVTVVSTKNRCKTYDTINVDVLKGMKIDNIDTKICLGQSVDIIGTGDPRYTYEWTSTDPNPQYSSPGAILNTITPSDTGLHTFTLKGKYFSCGTKDTVTELKIEVQPVPTVQVNDDIVMCHGDTAQLEAIVMPDTYGGYTYSWTPGAQLDYPDRRMPIFSAVQEGKFTLKLVVSTSAGCSDEDEMTLEVFSSTFMQLPNDTAICPGDTIALNAVIQEGSQFYWLPDYNISSVSSAAPRIWPVADQTYTAYGIDSFGCLDTQSVRVEVRPRATIDMPDSVVIYPGESYRVDPGGNCLYYTWFPPLGLSNADISNPSVSPKVNTRYLVHGRTEAGCGVTDTLDVFVKNDGILDLPNAFTPGKRSNGTLKIIRRGIADLKTFAVYNRWGAKVFETSDINEGWDGTFNGEPQPMGVYIYAIEAVAASGQTINKQGNVTLLK